MRKLFFLSVLFSSVLFHSCKKSGDDTDDNNGGGGTTGKRLVKVTQTGVINRVYNLSYDNNGRLVSMNSTDNVDKMTITYDANGNPVKLEEYNSQFHNIFTYTYNNNVPVSGTFKSWMLNTGAVYEDYSLDYSVSNGQVIGIIMNDNMTINSFVFGLEYDNNGNLTKIQNAGGSQTYTVRFTYGNKKPVFPRVFKYVVDQAGFSNHFYARNEITSTSYDFAGTSSDYTRNMQYTYDAEGYILTSTDGSIQATYQYE